MKIAPLSLYAIIKAIHEIQRFQLVQVKRNTLELRLIANDKENTFKKAKKAVSEYLFQNGVTCEIYLSDNAPQANANSRKFKHVLAMK